MKKISIKKILFKLSSWWMAETPVMARFLQTLAGALGAIPTYYDKLPAVFQAAIKPEVIGYVSLAGLVTAFVLQFFTKKKTN